MNCNNYKEWILTDYADDRLSIEARQDLEAHLKVCAACRDLAVKIKEANAAFGSVGPISLDQEKIWKRITDAIAPQESASVIYEPVRAQSRLEKLIRVLRPSLAWGTVVLILVMIAVQGGRSPGDQAAQQQDKRDSVEYLAYVVEELDFNGETERGFGTSLEDYFL